MKNLILILSLTLTTMTMSQKSIHNFVFKTIDGEQKSFKDFKGKKLLIFNGASKCGFTPQYEELQKLHSQYGAKLEVIGFPANNFGSQEPGTDDEIAAFCKKNYGVTFTMASKVSVKGDDIDPIFEWLCSQENKSFTGPIKWNFEKFFLDENGLLVERFRSDISPLSKSITKLIYKKAKKSY
ncbi:MAG: glutathione peroxidase [Crocinitomicaceae bacterium]|nr:glutathione peroxidase [Crocinitomicaceae bacterium]